MRRLAQRPREYSQARCITTSSSKQDLLVGVAERILNQHPPMISDNDPAQAALDIRAASLPIRDSADVISFVNAFRPATLVPFRALEQLFSTELPSQQAGWAAQTLIHYVFGFVAQEQNQSELIRARIVTDAADREATEQAFRFGVEAILRGLPVRER